MTQDENPRGDDWPAWWKARQLALESVFGPMDDLVGHAVVPFYFGFSNGGAADVVRFKKFLEGTVFVTAELIGYEDQKVNSLGAYELAICHRSDDEGRWGEATISKLAYYTLDAVVEPNQTMDLGSAVPAGSTITAFLFGAFARFVVKERGAGVLLCLGITADELALCHVGRRCEVESALKSAGVYPFTDLFRESVIKAGHA
jgi:hypothetical protein